MLVKSGEFHGVPLENYFTLCHIKYNGGHNPWAIRPADDGKVECNTVECATALLYSDLLYFLWDAIKFNIREDIFSAIYGFTRF